MYPLSKSAQVLIKIQDHQLVITLFISEQRHEIIVLGANFPDKVKPYCLTENKLEITL